MLSVDLAHRLRDAGLRWSPALGDRFVLANRGMDDEVFVLSNMTVEVHEFPQGKVIGFNGVTEWALDSVEQEEALWLPSESQLRELLGGLFRRLAREDEMWMVVFTLADTELAASAGSADEAYGLALLDVLTEVATPASPVQQG